MAGHKAPDFLVGLGASAGGLEALEHFFDGVPDKTGGAYVVVMHLSRDFKSMLDELLARHTKMEVKPAVDGENVRPDTVYVIQPGKTLEMIGNRFKVLSRPSIEETGVVSTIDKFFRSVATEWAERGCGVILSGSGSDGADGIIAINKAGGFTCAQSPETAKFDSMPVAAISTKAIRAVDAPEQLLAIIIDAVLLKTFAPQDFVVSETDAALSKISKAVVGLSTIDAAQYKHSMLERRVRKRMMHLQMRSLADYAELISSDPEEAKILGQTLLIGVTDFFRDTAAFKVIEQQVIPEIIQNAQASKRPIRIWTPGCATGQEAYSFALLFAAAFEDLPYKIEVQIFATDIKRDFLGSAARGTFTHEELKSVPQALKDKYFDPVNGSESLVISPDIRKMIIFAPHDILSDPPFTKLDMISCRNLLIYFSIDAQHKILSGFAFGLLKQGILFLGSSETVGAHRDSFEFIDARNRVFRRTNTKQTKLSFQAPLDKALRNSNILNRSRSTVRAKETALLPAYSAMLNEYAPDCLLLSSERELLYSFGKARRFLRPPEGLAHLDAAEMVDKALRTPLIAGLERTLRDQTSINFSRIVLEEYPKKGMMVDIEVRPLTMDSDSEQSHALVIIDEGGYKDRVRPTADTTVISSDKLDQERIEKLEIELNRTREALQSTIEEIETTNEELQSSNEELMSSNEELQSTNEELSSVNEELYSVNAEYHRQNDELTQLNTDFDLLLQSTQIGVIFLDNASRITKFTALARELFKLTEADLGRPIATFRSPFESINPESMIDQALGSKEIIEEEALDVNGVAWLIRAVAHENNFGSVLTIINIGRLRDAEIDVQLKNEMLGVMQDMMKAFYLELSHDLSDILSQIGLKTFLGRKPEEGENKIDFTTIHPDDHAILQKQIKKARRSKKVQFICRMYYGPDKDYRYVQFYGAKTKSGKWNVSGFDVHNYITAQNELAKRQAILDGVLKASPSLVSYIDENRKYVYVNQEYLDVWDTTYDNIIGKTVDKFLPPHLYAEAKPHIDAVLEDGKRQSFVLENVKPDGDTQRLSVVYQPVHGKNNETIGFVTDVLDVTKFYDHAEQVENLDRLLSIVARKSSYALFVVDVETLNLEYANPNALSRLGLPRTSILPKGLKITRLTPTWGEKTWTDWLKSKMPGIDLSRYDVIVFGSDGESSQADIYAGVAVDGGRLKAIIRVFDNKERINMFNDLQARSRELAMSNRDLEQFASVVAHDLSAPLRHITQFSEMVEEEIGDTKSEATEEYLSIIKSSVDKMSDMVGGLLKYSRLGLSTPAFEKVKLEDVINISKKLLSTDIKKYKAQINVTGAPKVFGDSDLLSRLFQNLLQNSIKYSKEGVAPIITVNAEEDGKLTRISLTDNGIGIRKEHSSAIFKLFQRLHKDDKYEGLGVGLATCQRITELHGGTISLDENWTDGTRFIIELPNKG